jgi:CheY-like chemotaxis protein
MALGTILLAEDNVDDVLLMKILLKKCGVLNPMNVVADGAEAIDYLTGKGVYAHRLLFPLPILFLLDLRMPRTSGWEVLRWLQSQPKPSFPIVVLTIYSDLRTMDDAYQLGATSFLVKPIQPDDFLPLLQIFQGIRIKGGTRGAARKPLRTKVLNRTGS